MRCGMWDISTTAAAAVALLKPQEKEGRQQANPGGKLGREFPKSEEDQSATRQEEPEQQQQHPINSRTIAQPYLT